MARAFDDVRVIDLTQVFAGPYATLMLAGLGADVVKLEPLAGDQGRRLLDHGPLAAAGMSPAFIGLNAGKRSLAIDLKRPEALALVRRLVESADVFVENSRPGAMERLGLSYEALSAVRPELIYCSISGYGQQGPRSDAPAYDGAVQASSGMMSIGGEPGQDPLRVAFPVIDMTTGLNACIAISSALYRRATHGEGQFLDVAMFDSALSIMSPVVNSYLVAGTEPYQTGNSSLTLQPTTDLFQTKNGTMQIAALTVAQIESLCATLGRSDLLADERFHTIADQITNREAMRAEIAPLFLERTRAEWVEILTQAGVPVGRVVTIPEALAEPQVRARRVIAEVPPVDLPGLEPPGGGEPLTIVNAGWEAGDEGPNNGAAAPRLGQHSDDVLRELGLDAPEIVRLRDDGVIS